MRTVIRRRITVESQTYADGHTGAYYTSGGEIAGSGTAQGQMFGRLPYQTYRVEFRLDPRGAYRVSPTHPAIPRVLRALPYARTFAYVCFLPKSWMGKRISRRVL